MKYFQSMVNVGLIFSFFYIVVVSWSIWYLVASITNLNDLPWTRCDQDYNSNICWEKNNSAIASQEYWSFHVLGQRGQNWDNFVSNCDGKHYSNGYTIRLSRAFSRETWGFIRTTGCKRISEL